jgi:predicted acetylornithine/succinylornithine family transaminase
MTEAVVSRETTMEQDGISEMDEDLFLQLYGKRDFGIVKGRGSYVWDREGNKYLDCVTGIAVNSLGHCFEPVVKAIEQQARKYLHGSNLYLMEPQHRLARILLDQTGFDKVFLCNSGTEANEAAIKFARKYWAGRGEPQRIEIIAFEKSFHGRTYGSLAATGQEKLKKNFGPMPDGFKILQLNNAESLEKAVTEKSAAVLVEPILAEGGIIGLESGFLAVLKEIQKKGVLLICDEIQTGLGRTGELLASQGLGLSPDLVTLAKALGGGLPLGCVLAKNFMADSLKKGDHGTTFGGNPVACAAGYEVLKALIEPGFLEGVKERSRYLREKMTALVQSHPDAGFEAPLLGSGFLVGIKYQKNLENFIRECGNNGLLVYRAGDDVIRLLPPINISYPEMDELVEKFSKSLI